MLGFSNERELSRIVADQPLSFAPDTHHDRATLTSSSPQADIPRQDSRTSRRPGFVVAFVNQKGGVGKTTSAVNIAACMAQSGRMVLLVDIDPQGNATSSLGVDRSDLDLTIYDALTNDAAANDVRIRAVRDGFDLLPASPMLAGAEVELVDADRREHRLADMLKPVQHDYDVILIDSPPSLGMLTVNALTAAGSVVIPVQCEYLALEGVSQVLSTIDLIRKGLNPDLELLGVLMTMYDGRTRLAGHVVDEVRRYFPDHLFSVVVPRSVRLAEAPSFGQVISEYDPSSRGARAYAGVTSELIARLESTSP